MEDGALAELTAGRLGDLLRPAPPAVAAVGEPAPEHPPGSVRVRAESRSDHDGPRGPGREDSPV